MSSYVLDKDLLSACLGSARRTEETSVKASWIDANCNANLLGTTLYQRTTDQETKKTLADVSPNKIPNLLKGKKEKRGKFKIVISK